MFLDQVYEEGNFYKITRFPLTSFAKNLTKTYKTTKIQNLFEGVGISFFGYRSIKVHRFFIPELIFLLKKFSFGGSLVNELIEKTWVSDYKKIPMSETTSMSSVSKEIHAKLNDYQAEFVKNYLEYKHVLQLKGMILSFDQGLGKTLTSLATLISIDVKQAIIVAPKSVLHTVWVEHIKKFMTDKKIYVIGESPLDDTYDYYIVNYEAINKLEPILGSLSSRGVGVIVDESHNFLNQSNRTKNVISLTKKLKCENILLLSGTPLKAIGSELIPMLMILDKYFDRDALEIFKKSFGISTGLANDILHARLSSIMYRKIKEDVLSLPEKIEKLIKISIPGGEKYTLENVKDGAKKFAEERMTFHKKEMPRYEKMFDEVIEYVHQNLSKRRDDFDMYLRIIKYLKTHKYDNRNKKMVDMAQWANTYEQEIIFPMLPNDLKRKFKECKTAVKYINMKIQGEVIGNYLNKLRMEMTTALVEHSDLPKYINYADKKTVIFTSFVDSIEATFKYLVSKKFNPLMVHGGTGDNAKSAVEKFRGDPDVNPLVASLKMLSTGVTLIEANTMIFLNKPFRYTDYLQASDRIHRIGQDVDVYIYTIILDTGASDNLSTRMEDIMVWSKEQFGGLVGDSTDTSKGA